MESLPESDITAVDFNDTELTLRLPGGDASPPPTFIGRSGYVKRGHFETVNLNLGRSGNPPRGEAFANDDDESESQSSSTGKSPAANKVQAIGWPPVRGFRKKALESRATTTYVKVAVDGAPYLRKVDLAAYDDYQDLLMELKKMFACFANTSDEGKLMDMMRGIEYVPTYEDKDGDWMLVGDVPFKMFKESCKRIRLMKSSKSLEIGNKYMM
ncbi:Auxin-responsive protein IAA15 [Camellia lanceoleosa]|uniref:Auxin-responsive protein IAA15 n=1 Tax=Camellia lanceoleosa TaxID=1840588 RepID=A0ACC0FLQ1_9ERIC|nr:Auxin-responsive protein IAA15 [Camellia lanceoleosa]